VATVPVTGVIPTKRMVGDSKEDTILLREMAVRAADYLRSFPWCAAILESYFGGGVGKVFAIFLFHLVPAKAEVDEWLWVVVGDIPSAYLVTDECRSPADVFEMYDSGMSRWTELARQGLTSPGVPTINVPPTPEWAEELDGRLKMLRSVVRPYLGNRGNSAYEGKTLPDSCQS
jgi:hypothetical protein